MAHPRIRQSPLTLCKGNVVVCSLDVNQLAMTVFTSFTVLLRFCQLSDIVRVTNFYILYIVHIVCIVCGRRGNGT